MRDGPARLAFLVALAVALVVVPGCSSDNGMTDVDLTGLWTVVADGVSPPKTVTCSGAHAGAGLANMSLCVLFDLDLQPNGAVFTGTSTQMYCGDDFSATVTVSGDQISGEIVIDLGATTQRFNFTGSVTGDAAFIDPGSFSQDGLTGSCTTSGFYSAVR